MRSSDWSSDVCSSDLAALETVIQQRAAAESVNVLGQQVLFSNPSGSCTPGKSAREVELMDLAQSSLAEGSRLVHAAVCCSELEVYPARRSELLAHSRPIQLFCPNVNVHRLQITQEDVINGLSNST